MDIGTPINDGNSGNSIHVGVYSNIDKSWAQIGDDINVEYVYYL